MERDYLSHNRVGVATQKLPNAERLPGQQTDIDGFIEEPQPALHLDGEGGLGMASGVQSHIV